MINLTLPKCQRLPVRSERVKELNLKAVILPCRRLTGTYPLSQIVGLRTTDPWLNCCQQGNALIDRRRVGKPVWRDQYTTTVRSKTAQIVLTHPKSTCSEAQ